MAMTRGEVLSELRSWLSRPFLDDERVCVGLVRQAVVGVVELRGGRGERDAEVPGDVRGMSVLT